MKKESIVYNENGSVNVEASIAKELKEIAEYDKDNKELRATFDKLTKLQEELKTSDLPDCTEHCDKILQALTQDCIADITRHELNKDGEVIHFENCEFEYKTDPQDLKYPITKEMSIRSLVSNLYYYDYNECYVTKLYSKDGEVLFENPTSPNADIIEIYESQVKKLGKIAADVFLQKEKSEFRYNLAFGEYYVSKTTSMLKDVVGLIEEGAKHIYPQMKKEWTEFMLLNATEPDLGEDEFDVSGAYQTAVEALKMLGNGSSKEEVSKYIEDVTSKRTLINSFDIYCTLAKFGKESGVQIFEEKIVKPSERSGEVSYSDYHVCSTDKAKAFAAKCRENNKKHGEKTLR